MKSFMDSFLFWFNVSRFLFFICFLVWKDFAGFKFLQDLLFSLLSLSLFRFFSLFEFLKSAPIFCDFFEITFLDFFEVTFFAFFEVTFLFVFFRSYFLRFSEVTFQKLISLISAKFEKTFELQVATNKSFRGKVQAPNSSTDSKKKNTTSNTRLPDEIYTYKCINVVQIFQTIFQGFLDFSLDFLGIFKGNYLIYV